MPLRVQLNNNQVGILTLSEIDPGQLDKFEAELKRSEENEGVIYNYSISLEFNKQGRGFIQEVFEIQGIDGVISVSIYQYNPNTYNWEIAYTGEIKLDDYDISETELSVSIEKVSFERKFINLQEVDIDIESIQTRQGLVLPAASTENITYHAKTILKRYKARPTDENEFLLPGIAFFSAPACATPGGCDRNREAILYGQIDTGDAENDELDVTFIQSWGWSEVEPAEVYRALEGGVCDIDISMNLKHRVTVDNTGGDYDIVGCGDNNLGKLEIKAWFEHRRENDTIVTLTQIGSDWSIPACPGFDTFESSFELKTYQDTAVNIEAGDKIFVYYTVRIFGNYNQNLAGSAWTASHEIGVEAVKDDTFISLETKTIFPATSVKSMLIYEVLERLCQVMTDQETAFRSDFFGRTDTSPAYGSDGPGSLLIYTNGRNLRDSDNKQLFANFKDLFISLNAKFCLAWGFETLSDGTRIVRVEPKSYFYDKETKVLEFGNVSNIKMKTRKDLHINTVDIGYPRIENIRQKNGIDEFNSVRQFASPISRASTKQQLISKYRSGGFEIETQRRLKSSSEESRLDDEGFITAIIRDGGEPSGFKTEQNENYPTVNNLFEPETSYNIRLSPRRSLEYWREILAATIIRGEKKVFSFQSGELNYLMESQETGEALVSEKDNLDLTGVEAIYLPDEYEFEAPFTADKFKIIEENSYGYFTAIDYAGNEIEGFLLSLKYVFETKKATVRLLRLYRP